MTKNQERIIKVNKIRLSKIRFLGFLLWFKIKNLYKDIKSIKTKAYLQKHNNNKTYYTFTIVNIQYFNTIQVRSITISLFNMTINALYEKKK